VGFRHVENKKGERYYVVGFRYVECKNRPHPLWVFVMLRVRRVKGIMWWVFVMLSVRIGPTSSGFSLC
jgi:hypothetical protein